MTNTLPEVGAFYVASWGYDQTNVDFYKVIGVTAKCVKVQHWTTCVLGGRGGPQEDVVPGDQPAKVTDWTDPANPVEVDAPILTKRPNGGWITLGRGYMYGKVWDGKPKYQTGLGWGH